MWVALSSTLLALTFALDLLHQSSEEHKVVVGIDRAFPRQKDWVAGRYLLEVARGVREAQASGIRPWVTGLCERVAFRPRIRAIEQEADL
jgi:hypothetical protein